MLKVSDNRRFLVQQDGTPFFYLGDTAWELFHRLNREDADHYLETRAAQRFTVIQAVVLAEHEYERPNPYGHLPLFDNDPTRPDDDYFLHVDYIVNKAEELGLFIGMLPTWGDKWNKKWGAGPEIFTQDNAFSFGDYLGRRYAEKPIIWILGGDRTVEIETHFAILRAMAAGLKQGDGGKHLCTFHPQGQQTSAQYFHEDDWLDFNMWQTGHSRNRDSYNSIAADYHRTPIKPCMDAEPGYEDHPNGFKAENGYLNEYDVRKSAYWALFSGGHGHTYGCHDMWQFLQPAWKPVTVPRTPWRTAILFPGAQQMQYVRNLLEARPFLTRIPDQTLILSDNPNGPDHIQATRCETGSYALLYIPTGKPVTVALDKLSGSEIIARWYDVHNGSIAQIGSFPQGGQQEFIPPDGGDWVLVLDDASQGFPPPGRVG